MDDSSGEFGPSSAPSGADGKAGMTAPAPGERHGIVARLARWRAARAERAARNAFYIRDFNAIMARLDEEMPKHLERMDTLLASLARRA